MPELEVIGLDTIGIVVLVGAVAVLLGYILVLGWNFEFTKGQFVYVTFFLLLLGMFVEAWFRETGDELLIGLAMGGMMLYLVLRWFAERRRRKWLKSSAW